METVSRLEVCSRFRSDLQPHRQRSRPFPLLAPKLQKKVVGRFDGRKVVGDLPLATELAAHKREASINECARIQAFFLCMCALPTAENSNKFPLHLFHARGPLLLMAGQLGCDKDLETVSVLASLWTELSWRVHHT